MYVTWCTNVLSYCKEGFKDLKGILIAAVDDLKLENGTLVRWGKCGKLRIVYSNRSKSTMEHNRSNVNEN